MVSSPVVSNAATIRVRWSDADPAGIVFYPRFFEWFDLGTEALFAAVGLPWAECFPAYDVVGVPIVESTSRFVSPVRYGDTVTVRSRVAWLKTKTFRIEHEIVVADRLCASGHEVRAWVGRPRTAGERLRARAIPPEVAAKLGADNRG
jgi:4-hydroxybenzoyl-CoA thioesterase